MTGDEFDEQLTEVASNPDSKLVEAIRRVYRVRIYLARVRVLFGKIWKRMPKWEKKTFLVALANRTRVYGKCQVEQREGFERVAPKVTPEIESMLPRHNADAMVIIGNDGKRWGLFKRQGRVRLSEKRKSLTLEDDGFTVVILHRPSIFIGLSEQDKNEFLTYVKVYLKAKQGIDNIDNPSQINHFLSDSMKLRRSGKN